MLGKLGDITVNTLNRFFVLRFFLKRISMAYNEIFYNIAANKSLEIKIAKKRS